MINSQNNERLFFADRVLLVEGISDRLVFEALVESVSTRFNVTAAIEVIEVGGKNNFADYAVVLHGLLTPAFIVADLDYLTIVGSPGTTALFQPDFEDQWGILVEGKKSTDRTSMISYLNSAIETNDATELRKFWNYFVCRLKRLKAPLTPAESMLLNEDLDRLRAENKFILRAGEVEDYLPPGGRDVRSIVALVSDRHWINRVPTPERRVELGEIVCGIVGIPENDRVHFLGELRDAAVTFPMSGQTGREA